MLVKALMVQSQFKYLFLKELILIFLFLTCFGELISVYYSVSQSN